MVFPSYCGLGPAAWSWAPSGAARSDSTADHSTIIAVTSVAYRFGKGSFGFRRSLTSMEAAQKCRSLNLDGPHSSPACLQLHSTQPLIIMVLQSHTGDVFGTGNTKGTSARSIG